MENHADANNGSPAVYPFQAVYTMDALQQVSRSLSLSLDEEERRARLLDEQVRRATWELVTCSCSEYLTTMIGIDADKIPDVNGGRPWMARRISPWVSRRQKLTYLKTVKATMARKIDKIEEQLEQVDKLITLGTEFGAPRAAARPPMDLGVRLRPDSAGGRAARVWPNGNTVACFFCEEEDRARGVEDQARANGLNVPGGGLFGSVPLQGQRSETQARPAGGLFGTVPSQDQRVEAQRGPTSGLFGSVPLQRQPSESSFSLLDAAVITAKDMLEDLTPEQRREVMDWYHSAD